MPSDQMPQNPTGDLLHHARVSAGLGLREMARRAKTSHATLSAYEQGRKVPSVATFLRLVDACDYAVDVELKPRIRHAHGQPRGDELEQALALAEEFPSRHAQHRAALNYPRFPQPRG